LLDIALIELLIAGGPPAGWQVFATQARKGLIGAAAGASGGLVIVGVLNGIAMPGGLHPIFVTACAVSIYGITPVQGSGFVVVYLAGMGSLPH
jgi:cell volume regulation protein A